MILEPTIRTVLPVRTGLSPNLGESFENIIVSESFFFQFNFFLPVFIDFTHFNSLFITCYTIETFKVFIFKFIVERFLWNSKFTRRGNDIWNNINSAHEVPSSSGVIWMRFGPGIISVKNLSKPWFSFRFKKFKNLFQFISKFFWLFRS